MRTAPGLMSTAASQTIDGDRDGGPFKHLDQPVEKRFVVVMSWLKILFKNVLGFNDGLNNSDRSLLFFFAIVCWSVFA